MVDVSVLVEQRKRDAWNRRIYVKASEIAHRLGRASPKKHGCLWFYEDGELFIGWDDFAPNLWIRWNGLQVFDVHLGDVTCYRPDVEGWIQRVEELYSSRVLPLLEAEREREELRRIHELAEKWGIVAEKSKPLGSSPRRWEP
jgi:hypothetical protein